MQKLLRRTPSAPPILTSPLSLPIPNTSFLSLSFRDGANGIIRKMSNSTHRLPQFHPLHAKTPFPSAAHAFKLTKLPRSGCRPCSCSARSGAAAPFRAWVVLKKSNRYGSGSHRAAWYATVAGNSSTEGEFPAAEGGGNEKENVEGEEERKLSRRRGGGGGGGAAVVGSPDLLTIPGVGPRNLRKLVEKGFEGVAQLKQLYKDKFYGKSSEKMVEFLRSSVGIIHKNHAESITTFIKDSVDEELKEDVKPVQKKRITLCIEGNISVGKTTFLQRIANETLELQDLVEIVPEPVDKWQNVGPNNLNILEKFYAEPERYAYTFQNYVFATRVMQERESCGGIRPLRLMERSVFSDRMVFVRAVHEAKWMNEMEISIYDSWFDPVVSVLPGLIPDGFIYLRASPDTCHKRMMLRQRAEEGSVSLDYLRDLHEKHESWLFPFQSGNHGVLSVSDMPKDVDWSLHPSIKERVFYLKGDHMHSCIQKVPALVLDCEPDIDFSRDIEAKREYARQVAEFFELVKKKKEVGEVPGIPSQSPVVIPDTGKLWMPGTLDLGQKAMTFMPH